MRTISRGMLVVIVLSGLTEVGSAADRTANFRRTRQAAAEQPAPEDSQTQLVAAHEPVDELANYDNGEPLLLEQPYGLSSPAFPGYVSGYSYQLHPTSYRVRWTERQPPRPSFFRTCTYYRGGNVVPGSPLARACGHCQPPVWLPVLVPPPPSCGRNCGCRHHR